MKETGGGGQWECTETLVRESEDTTPFETHRHIRKDHITIDIQAIGVRICAGSIWLRVKTEMWQTLRNTIIIFRVYFYSLHPVT
jgi:hypothetical protein